MKRKFMSLLLAMSLAASMLALPAMAAETPDGIYGIKSLDMSASVVPVDLDNNEISGESTNIGGTPGTIHPNAVRFEMSFTGEANKEYLVTIKKKATVKAGTDDLLTDLVYINQYTADAEGSVKCEGVDAPYPMSLELGNYIISINGTPAAKFSYNSSGVKVEGLVTTHNPNNSVTVKLLQNGVVKKTVTLNPEGGRGIVSQNYAITNVAPGKYDLEISKSAHLSYTVTDVEVGSSNLTMKAITLPVGDVNSDGHVNSTDLGIMIGKENYGMSTESANQKKTDLDGDGNVNSTDLGIMIGKENYGQSAIKVKYTAG